jgi:hypothetical protein
MDHDISSNYKWKSSQEAEFITHDRVVLVANITHKTCTNMFCARSTHQTGFQVLIINRALGLSSGGTPLASCVTCVDKAVARSLDAAGIKSTASSYSRRLTRTTSRCPVQQNPRRQLQAFPRRARHIIDNLRAFFDRPGTSRSRSFNVSFYRVRSFSFCDVLTSCLTLCSPLNPALLLVSASVTAFAHAIDTTATSRHQG